MQRALVEHGIGDLGAQMLGSLRQRPNQGGIGVDELEQLTEQAAIAVQQPVHPVTAEAVAEDELGGAVLPV